MHETLQVALRPRKDEFPYTFYGDECREKFLDKLFFDYLSCELCSQIYYEPFDIVLEATVGDLHWIARDNGYSWSAEGYYTLQPDRTRLYARFITVGKLKGLDGIVYVTCDQGINPYVAVRKKRVAILASDDGKVIVVTASSALDEAVRQEFLGGIEYPGKN